MCQDHLSTWKWIANSKKAKWNNKPPVLDLTNPSVYWMPWIQRFSSCLTIVLTRRSKEHTTHLTPRWLPRATPYLNALCCANCHFNATETSDLRNVHTLQFYSVHWMRKLLRKPKENVRSTFKASRIKKVSAYHLNRVFSRHGIKPKAISGLRNTPRLLYNCTERGKIRLIGPGLVPQKMFNPANPTICNLNGDFLYRRLSLLATET